MLLSTGILDLSSTLKWKKQLECMHLTNWFRRSGVPLTSLPKMADLRQAAFAFGKQLQLC
jgi:hypothetical protein